MESPKRSFSRLGIILISVLILVLVIFSAYLLSFKFIVPTSPVINSQDNSFDTKTSMTSDEFYQSLIAPGHIQNQFTTLDTTGWKIYRNNEFEFKYPQEWTYVYESPKYISVSSLKPQGETDDLQTKVTIVRSADSNEINPKPISKTMVVFSGVVAEMSVWTFGMGNMLYKDIFIPSKGLVVVVAAREERDIPVLNSIFQTFRFTN